MTAHLLSQSAILVQPSTLLTTAAAAVTVETLNETLLSYGLCLPIDALAPGLTLADLIARNAGGRRRLRYGTIARYVRAATLITNDESRITSTIQARINDPHPRLIVGGPTLKRATGYGLNRALVGGRQSFGMPRADMALETVTLSLRPLPPARRALLFRCADLLVACRLARDLLAAGLALSALAVREQDSINDAEKTGKTFLLVELEGTAAVVERQAAHITVLATTVGAQRVEQNIRTSCGSELWAEWERLAADWSEPFHCTLDLTLPRAALPDFIGSARRIAQCYRITLSLWGDLGVGALHLGLGNGAAGELQQAAALIYDRARRMGGAFSTEMGGGALMESFWQHDAPQLPNKPMIRPSSALSSHQSLIDKLREAVGPNYVLTRSEDMDCYAQDASIAQATGQPLAVVLPASTAEVSAVMRLAAEVDIPIVTRGAGSGLAGGSLPTPGALVLVLTRMERLSVDPVQMTAHAEAGVITADLQRAAENYGLLYPPDPSSQGISTIGGNIACNAGGPRCLKYGVTADYVLGLTAVLADGAIIRAGDGLVGQSPDAGLLQVLIGSEGTLAVITEATLRLIPQPAARRTVTAIFDSLDTACTTVETIMAAGLVPASLELMDDTTIAVVDEYLHLGLPRDAEALLLLMADGEPEAVLEEAEQLSKLARSGGARTVQVARTAADEAALWRARRAIAPALARVRPNRLGEDICVPLNQIANCVRQIKAIAAKHDQPIVVFGHAGDGNLHPNILFDSRDPAQVTRVWAAAEAIFRVALDLG
ncbi:MAG: FAD-binding protein, partial [Chloroflexales bacterium]|nr:FAD-binding protein [Chloroflexales bacterium]